jgi:hypothetical protein
LTLNSPLRATNSRVPSSGSTDQNRVQWRRVAYGTASPSSASIGTPGQRGQPRLQQRLRAQVGLGDRAGVVLERTAKSPP